MGSNFLPGDRGRVRRLSNPLLLPPRIQRKKPGCLAPERNLLRQWFKNADLYYGTVVVGRDGIPCFWDLDLKPR